jgi:hypothetical protein
MLSVMFACTSVASAKTFTVKYYGGGQKVQVQRYRLPGKYDGRVPTWISNQVKHRLRQYNAPESAVISASRYTETPQGLARQTDHYTFATSVNLLKRKAARQWKQPQPHVRGNIDAPTARIGRYPAYPVVKDGRFRKGQGFVVNRFASAPEPGTTAGKPDGTWLQATSIRTLMPPRAR